MVESFIHFRDLLSQHPMFGAGILLMAGYVLGKLVSIVKLPEITGYIIAGLLMGESVTGIFPSHMGESFTIITELALGLIALTIGGEFSRVKLKRMGKEAMIITLTQLAVTFGAVSLGLLLFDVELPFALLLGAVATATAPAATVAIVQSLRARGVFVDYLYGVVALDDAGCVMLFGVTFALASGLLHVGGASVGGTGLIVHAVLEVFFSVLIGMLSGFVLHVMTRKKENPNEILIISLGLIFLTSSISIVFHLSPLLTNMAAGCLLINLSARNHRIFRILAPLTPPIYALFFVIAGTELSPEIIFRKGILMQGMAFILLRGVGKYGGVYVGCRFSKVSVAIRHYLGLSMIPQAGVAIGLVLLIQTSPLMAHLAPEHTRIIGDMVNIVLLSVFVNELIGPPLSKFAIVRGNEMEA